MKRKKSLNNKEIKKFILDTSNDLDNIIDYLEMDYQSTIDGLFSALFVLLKNYDQNKSRVDYLFRLLEQLVEIKTIEELKIMIDPISNLNNKISDWSLKDRLEVNKPYQRIQEILNKINAKEVEALKNDRVKYLSFLIFQDKNLKMIEKMIDSTNSLFSCRDENGENIFETVLDKYLLLDEKDREEINYFYSVILLFMGSKYRKNIYANSKQYFRMIKRTKLEYKEHVIKIMELFEPEFHITLSELEQRYPIKFDFPNVILKENEKFDFCMDGSYDFTYQDAVTIDGNGSKCLDDALYIEKNLDGTYNLYVHIVSVPSFVPYNSLTREEASRRGETLYLSDRNILLYPDNISDYYCSLLPNMVRCTQTSIYKLDSEFNLIDDFYKLVKGKVCVKHKMTYNEVDKRLEHANGEELDILLECLKNFAMVRRSTNKKKEQYRELQNAVEFDPNRESLKLDSSFASNIVHEAMVLENYSRARYMKRLDLPYIYRKLELPSGDFIEEQLRLLKRLESNFVGSPEFMYKLKESYAKAQYAIKPTYHQGLHLPYYSHSSSPARRYCDAENQYMVDDMVFNGNRDDYNIRVWEYRAEKLIRDLNNVKKTNENFSSHYNYLAHKRLVKKK